MQPLSSALPIEITTRQAPFIVLQTHRKEAYSVEIVNPLKIVGTSRQSTTSSPWLAI